MEQEKHQTKKKISLVSAIVLVLVIVIGLIAGGAIYFIANENNTASGKVTVITQSKLKDVIEVSELSTVAYTYNAIVPAYKKDGKTLKYHVAYEGIVKAGIDFEDIQIEVDEEKKIITITIPDVKILDCAVDEGTLEFIFEKDKYNKETVAAEAYKLCLADLEDRAEQEPELIDLARENALSAVKGLIEPWVNQVDDEYTVEVK